MSEPIKIFEIQPKEMNADMVRGTLTPKEIGYIRDACQNWGIDLEAEAYRYAMLKNTATFAQYETWASIDAGCGVKVILHYGAPPVCYPLELRYRDIFDYEMMGLFAAIFDVRVADPFVLMPMSNYLLGRGYQSILNWTMQLFKTRFADENWIDFELLNQRLYVCLDEENYEKVQERVSGLWAGEHDLSVPSEKYKEYLQRRKYLLLN